MKYLITLAAALLLVGPAAALPSSITSNDPSPVYGSTPSFSLTAPRAAFTNDHNTQQHNNPQLQLDCSQNGVHVWTSNWGGDKQANWVNNHDGSFTYPAAILAPYGTGGNGNTWTSGAADCSALLYSYSQGQITNWATLQFTVGA